MLVRPATMDDMSCMLSIERECFGRERFTRSFILSLMTSDQVDVLVGTEEGRAIASAMVLHGPVGLSSRILSLAISPRHQGKGLSRRLLVDVEERSRQRGSCKIFLEVRVENEAAIGLYSRSGYFVGDRIPDFFGRGQDAWYMEKTFQ